MAGPLFKLFGTLGLDARQFDDGLTKREKMLRGFGQATLGGLGLGAGLSAFSVVQSGISGIVSGIGEATQAASDFNEQNSKVGVVFEDTAGEVRAWADTTSESFGISERAALEAAGSLGNFLQAMGTAEVESASMSRELVELSADLASFNNAAGGAEEVLLAIRSGLAGETEPLRKFGVDISDAAVQAELLASGFQKVGKEFTQAQKIQGRYNIIMRQTEKAQGDFARTSDGLANSQRILDAEVEDLRVELGKAFLPVQQQVTRGTLDLLRGLNDLGKASTAWSQGVRERARAIGAIGQAAQDSLEDVGALEQISRLIDDLQPAEREFREFWEGTKLFDGEDLGKLARASGAMTFSEFRAGLIAARSRFRGDSTAAYRWFMDDMRLLWESLDQDNEIRRARTAMVTLPRDEAERSMQDVNDLWQREYRERLAGMKLITALEPDDSPFRTLFDEDDEAIKEDFRDIRAEIRAGFGSVKQALQGGGMKIIDPETRMRNMRHRLHAAARNLRQAIEVGDPMAEDYWRAAVQKQRLQLDTFKDRTSDTFRDVQRDSVGKARRTADGVLEQARRLRRELRRISLYDAGMKMIESWKAGVAAGIPALLPGGYPSMPTGPRLAVSGRGGQTFSITVNGMYGGPAGLRQLAREIRREIRLAERER